LILNLGDKLSRLKPPSASVRDVLKLAGGTAGSQVITVAATPIITRLYGPESFGVLATFASILALLNVVSSLRYELAIAVPEDDDEAITLVWLCFVLVAISTALTALGVVLLRNQLVGWLQQPVLKPLLWLLPGWWPHQ
jgi:O-antigen/teichoic acid export membrane protein